MKEPRPFVMPSRQTHHSLNLISSFLNDPAPPEIYSPSPLSALPVYSIGDEGAKAICEALKTNTSLTQLNLWVTQLPPSNKQHCALSHFPKSQRISLDLKEPRPFVRHSRQTHHSLDFISELHNHHNINNTVHCHTFLNYSEWHWR